MLVFYSFSISWGSHIHHQKSWPSSSHKAMLSSFSSRLLTGSIPHPRGFIPHPRGSKPRCLSGHCTSWHHTGCFDLITKLNLHFMVHFNLLPDLELASHGEMGSQASVWTAGHKFISISIYLCIYIFKKQINTITYLVSIVKTVIHKPGDQGGLPNYKRREKIIFKQQWKKKISTALGVALIWQQLPISGHSSYTFLGNSQLEISFPKWQRQINLCRSKMNHGDNLALKSGVLITKNPLFALGEQ